MIKGINRQVIEVTETGNPYFERALLVVRPSYRDDDESRLREEARRMVHAACGYSGMRLGRRRGCATGFFCRLVLRPPAG